MELGFSVWQQQSCLLYNIVESTYWGFLRRFLSKQLYRGGCYHQHQRQFLQDGFPFLFPRPTVGPVPPRGSAGRLQHCAMVCYWRGTFHHSHRLLGGPHLHFQFRPAILFSEYSLSTICLCHLLFLPSRTFRTPVCLIFVFWGDFSPLRPPTCHFPLLSTGALKIFPVLSAFIVFSW